jgi:hypothetical protein
MSTSLCLASVLVLAAACGGAPAPAKETTMPAPTSAPAATPPTYLAPAPRTDLPAGSTYTLDRTGDLHDFDDLAGAWVFANRRLKARGVGSDEWDEFPAVSCTTIHLGGVANVDEIQFPTKGWGGLTVRTFDVKKRQWSIYWVNSRDGLMFPPVVGGFDGNRGEFYGEDTDDGRPILVRFVWTKLGNERFRWEQWFSYDGGVAWEMNWTNTLSRAPAGTCVDGVPVVK